MSYWLGRRSGTPQGIAITHQIAVSIEPEGATFGWLVECFCGYQARVPRLENETDVRNICEGTAKNHFDRHSLETVNREVIWDSEAFSKKPDLTLEQPQEQQSVGQSADQVGQSSVPKLASVEAKPQVELPSPKNIKEAASPSPQPSVPLQTPVVKTVPTPSPSTGSQVASTESQQPSVQTKSEQAPAPSVQTPSTQTEQSK